MAVLLVSIAGLSIGLRLFFLFFSVLFGRGFATRAQGDPAVLCQLLAFIIVKRFAGRHFHPNSTT